MKSLNIYLRFTTEASSIKPNFDWLTLAPAIAAGAIVIIGWLVVERFARRRERRSDLRAAVQSFGDAVGEVRSASIAFYKLAGNDAQSHSLAATMRSKLSALSDHLEVLGAAGLSIDADDLLKRYRQSVTGGDFDSQTRQPLNESSPAFVRMSGDAQALTRAVELAMLKMLLPK